MQREFITFEAAGQMFGIDVMAIREIRAWTPVAALPHVPDYVAGVVNLRGTILPVIDLAARFGWRATEPTGRHAIIVTHLGNKVCGLLVDSVSDIVGLPDEALQPPPAIGQDGVVPFLEGLCTIEDGMVMVIDLHKLAAPDDMATAA